MQDPVSTSPAPEADLRARGLAARAAARHMARATRRDKDGALLAIADALTGARPTRTTPERVLAENQADIARAREAGLDEAMIDRLALTPERLRQIADAVRQIAAFDDPVGTFLGMKRRPNGLSVGQVRIPLGVIAMIYESRPNVTVDAAALCLKAGNAVLLRGGKEAARSNLALGELVREAIAGAGLAPDAVQIVPPLGREETKALVQMTGVIDLCIPRGGEGLIRFVTEHARVPVVQHYKGVCHLYVDAGADVEMAAALVANGKLQRTSVCNALECLLVHADEAAALLPKVDALVDRGLELRAEARAKAHLPRAKAAAPDDFGQEFLAPILAVAVVDSFDAALDHIARYGSNHTESICTRDYARSQRFLREVDASCVLVNASTRFNDGGELGLGAEIGISTSKLHAYGPMGIESLTAIKWVVLGEGQTR
jgi:glutamate-5-semialdehyde dehydrogenase